jgi:hypothetical protein
MGLRPRGHEERKEIITCAVGGIDTVAGGDPLHPVKEKTRNPRGAAFAKVVWAT